MSSFLPDSSLIATSGDAQRTNQKALSDADRALIERLFSSPQAIPSAFFSYVVDFIQTQNLLIPITQIVGFSQFTASSASVIASESTTSGSYVDLATVGPSLTGLSDGQYLVIFGAAIQISAGTDLAFMAVQVNATTPADNDAMKTVSTVLVPGSRAITATLNSGGNNTLTAKYHATGGKTASFENRWLVALKLANS